MPTSFSFTTQTPTRGNQNIFGLLTKLQILEPLARFNNTTVYVACTAQSDLFLAGIFDQQKLCDNWLYIPISPQRLAQYKAGQHPFRQAFTNPEFWVAHIKTTHQETAVDVLSFLQPEHIPQNWLPNPEWFLTPQP